MCRCTLSINKSGNKSCAFAIHADVSPVKLMLHHQSLGGLVRLAQAALHSLRPPLATQSDKKFQDGAASVPPPPPMDGSVVLLQKSLGSLSESTPVSYSRAAEPPESTGTGGRHVSLWMQWTVPSCALVLETENRQRLTLSLEDNSLSFDGQATYTKVKLRVRTLHSLVEERGGEGGGEYEAAPFPNCFLSTRAGFLNRLSTLGQDESAEEPVEKTNQYSSGFSVTITRYDDCLLIFLSFFVNKKLKKDV
jgi:hypothetical protein